MTVRPFGVAVISVGLLGACVPPAPPASTAVVVNSSATVVNGPPSEGMSELPPEAQGMLVTVDKHLPRPTELVGVLDFHSDAQSEDKGFNELRRRALAIGAEAVIGAEFEHGDGGAPSHLSGVAVRFLDHD